MTNVYDGYLKAVINDIHPALVDGYDFLLRNDSDGNGDKIVFWGPTTSPVPSQPTTTELETTWTTITSIRIAQTELVQYSIRTGLIGIYQITDPLGRVPRPSAPITASKALRYVALRKMSWSVEFAAPTFSPNINSQMGAAVNLEDDWYLAAGGVVAKVEDGTYTTEADVDNATEWP